jgi:anti-sigma regulatory factor (Ser/Thr protein kinase)
VVPLASTGDTAALRRYLRELLTKQGLANTPRADDLLTAVTEAATNAVKHAGNGEARIWLNGDNARVVVSDHGHGIQPTNLARATLETGYSSRATLGMGYALMLETVDRLALCTSDSGTSVLIDVNFRPRAANEERLLGRFVPSEAAGRPL